MLDAVVVETLVIVRRDVVVNVVELAEESVKVAELVGSVVVTADVESAKKVDVSDSAGKSAEVVVTVDLEGNFVDVVENEEAIDVVESKIDPDVVIDAEVANVDVDVPESPTEEFVSATMTWRTVAAFAIDPRGAAPVAPNIMVVSARIMRSVVILKDYRQLLTTPRSSKSRIYALP